MAISVPCNIASFQTFPESRRNIHIRQSVSLGACLKRLLSFCVRHVRQVASMIPVTQFLVFVLLSLHAQNQVPFCFLTTTHSVEFSLILVRSKSVFLVNC